MKPLTSAGWLVLASLAGCSSGGVGGARYANTNFPTGTYNPTVTLLTFCTTGPAGNIESAHTLVFETDRFLLDGGEVSEGATVRNGTVADLEIAANRIGFSIDGSAGSESYIIEIESTGNIRYSESVRTESGSNTCNGFGATDLN